MKKNEEKAKVFIKYADKKVDKLTTNLKRRIKSEHNYIK